MNKKVDRILIAEDTEVARVAMSKTLADSGYSVVEADCGEVALAECQRKMPDLAIIDIGLPDLSGLVVADYIKDHIPFIVVTADGSHASRQECIGAGAYSYLVKPFNPNQLTPIVETALARARDHYNISLALDRTQKFNIAVGIIMARKALSVEEAKAKLLKSATDSRKSAAEKADEVIQANSAFNL